MLKLFAEDATGRLLFLPQFDVHRVPIENFKGCEKNWSFYTWKTNGMHGHDREYGFRILGCSFTFTPDWSA